ncbi:MAG: hypothetical protein K2P63_09970 [Lachnospiraceae bacterium]|nr:hypothetical protein [Lachnospiraceae bacterium]
MFKSRYQEAYDAIAPSPELVADVMARAVGEGKGKRAAIKFRKNRFARRAALTAAAVLVCFAAAVPVCAARVPAFYRIVEFLSPALADKLVPIEESSTSQGITMQVEAVHLMGNEADIIISLRDAAGSGQDLVNGEMDLYDSYGLSDYMNDSVIGGCRFLTYDETEDKAFFQVMVQSDKAYQSGKLKFRVRSVLCGKYKETRDVDLSGTVYEADTKLVSLSGSGGLMREEELPVSLQETTGTPDDPRPGVKVLDGIKAADCAADGFTVTGIAYMDGALRVQMCMGDNWKSDRNVELFLRDADGGERYSDRSVSWHEAVGDTSYQFYEFWYLEEIESIADYSMYGIFHESGEMVEGDWNVTFRLQKD